jgi:hypothetical protein
MVTNYLLYSEIPEASRTNIRLHPSSEASRACFTLTTNSIKSIRAGSSVDRPPEPYYRIRSPSRLARDGSVSLVDKKYVKMQGFLLTNHTEDNAVPELAVGSPTANQLHDVNIHTTAQPVVRHRLFWLPVRHFLFIRLELPFFAERAVLVCSRRGLRRPNFLALQRPHLHPSYFRIDSQDKPLPRWKTRTPSTLRLEIKQKQREAHRQNQEITRDFDQGQRMPTARTMNKFL